jgi:RecJ-like exonuclease
MGPVPELDDCARACARRLGEAEEVLLASHIDADGLTSAAIASTALARAEIPHEVVFRKQLDEAAIAEIAARDPDTVLFTDFGSGQLDDIVAHEQAGDFEPVIADHHQPADAETAFHLNPLLFGIDGASELSGAGTSYVLARALADEVGTQASTDGGVESVAGAVDNSDASDEVTGNRDLAALAVVGAVGDMQATRGELTGANREIVAEGIEASVLEEATDLALYGKQTRPLPKLLEYASEVRIPGISNDQQGAVSFLKNLDVETHDGEDWRRWVDLGDDERQTVASALLQRALERGVPPGKAEQLVGTTYTLVREQPGTELRDASEFSTLLNATARYERADVGLAVCLGDRGEAFERARRLLANHRRNLSEGLDIVKREGVDRTDNLQWFDAGEQIRETIVGIVAGMALGTDGVDPDRPIVAFAKKNDDERKVSARGTGRLVGRGLDLSTVVGEAAREVGGDGGGHDIAAGATIPAGETETFVKHADAIVDRQLS